MRALVVQQPYAELIASGEKILENRGWSTRHRGPLAIVAGRGNKYLTAAELAGYVTGRVVCVVDVIDCIPLADLPPELRENVHAHGPICWTLANVRRVHNGPEVRGMPGLISVPDSSLDLLDQRGDCGAGCVQAAAEI